MKEILEEYGLIIIESISAGASILLLALLLGWLGKYLFFMMSTWMGG